MSGDEIPLGKPAFLTGNIEEAYPGGADPAVPQGKPLKPRPREVARMLAMGKTQKEICEKLGYSQARVSILSRMPEVIAEVQRIQDLMLAEDITVRMKDLGHDAMDALEELLRDPNVKAKDKIDSARWLLEKLTGKAKQEVNVESNTVARFMELVQGMQRRGETLDQPIDVTPASASDPGAREVSELPELHAGSDLEKWVDDNL